jgi:signal peptidase I
MSADYLTQKVFTLVKIQGNSMLPNIKDGSYGIFLLLNQKSKNTLQRKEIYLLKKNSSDIFSVKRLTAMPKEEVWVDGGNIYINGIVVAVRKAEEQSSIDCRYSKTTILKENEYYFLGDNFCNSMDSRKTGPYVQDEIKGRLILNFTFDLE